ncbi:MAG: hypothetical protein ACHP7N_08100, partial [Caulobacterales bacterium]
MSAILAGGAAMAAPADVSSEVSSSQPPLNEQGAHAVAPPDHSGALQASPESFWTTPSPWSGWSFANWPGSNSVSPPPPPPPP